jgi:putative membrane protein
MPWLTFLIHLLVTAVLLLVVGRIVPGIEVRGGLAAVGGALVLGVVNAVVRPLAVVLTLPLTVLTFGLFLWIVNGAMLALAAALVPGFVVRGCLAALLGSLVLSLLNTLVVVLAG